MRTKESWRRRQKLKMALVTLAGCMVLIAVVALVMLGTSNVGMWLGRWLRP